MMEYENTSVKIISNSGSGGASVDAPLSTEPPPQIPVKKKRNLPGTPGKWYWSCKIVMLSV